MQPTSVIYYRLCKSAHDFSILPLDEQEAFLGPAERQKLASMRFPKRRGDWLMGRWTSKQLLRGCRAEFASLALTEIEIGNTVEGVPVLSFPGSQSFHGTLSISHTHQNAFCALSFDQSIKIGADMEKIEPRTPGFCEDYFTSAEIRQRDELPAKDQITWINLVWSAKEAMLKALGKGMRLDTRKVEILPVEKVDEAIAAWAGWQPLQICSSLPEPWHWAAWWMHQGEFVCTLAALSAEEIDPQNIRLLEVA